MEPERTDLDYRDFNLARNEITKQLQNNLDNGQNVLWLVSGGSAIELEVAIRNQLTLTTTSKLTVALIDERYVPLDDSNSNLKQLLDNGFETSRLTLIPVLKSDLTLEDTASTYNQTLSALLHHADVSVGIFGMGADGHTAGLLPHCPLLDDGEQPLVESYIGSDFQRISLTPAGIAQITIGVLYTAGETKWPQLARLKEAVPPNLMPVQLLKHFKPLRIYTDYKGGNV